MSVSQGRHAQPGKPVLPRALVRAAIAVSSAGVALAAGPAVCVAAVPPPVAASAHPAPTPAGAPQAQEPAMLGRVSPSQDARGQAQQGQAQRDQVRRRHAQGTQRHRAPWHPGALYRGPELQRGPELESPVRTGGGPAALAGVGSAAGPTVARQGPRERSDGHPPVPRRGGARVAPAASTAVDGASRGVRTGVSAALAPVGGLKPNPLAGTGVDPLSNSVGTRVGDLPPVSTRLVTDPLTQGGSLGQVAESGPLTPSA